MYKKFYCCLGKPQNNYFLVVRMWLLTLFCPVACFVLPYKSFGFSSKNPPGSATLLKRMNTCIRFHESLDLMVPRKRNVCILNNKRSATRYLQQISFPLPWFSTKGLFLEKIVSSIGKPQKKLFCDKKLSWS